MPRKTHFFYSVGKTVEGAGLSIISLDVKTRREETTIYTVSCGNCERRYSISHNGIAKRIRGKMNRCEKCCDRRCKTRFKQYQPNTEVKEAGLTVIRATNRTSNQHTTTYMVECSHCGHMYEISHNGIMQRITLQTKKCSECKNHKEENPSWYPEIVPPMWNPPKI